MIGKKTLKEIDKMKGLDFEVFIGELLTQHGYKTQNIKGSGDFGVDVIAEKGGTKYAVQVKRYQSNVSRTAISDAVAGKFHWDCEKAWVITNSYFTSDAKLLAKSTDCKLTDRDELKNMMKDGSTFASIFEGGAKKNRKPFFRSIWGTLFLLGLAALAFYAIRFIPQSSFDQLWNNATSIFSSSTQNSTNDDTLLIPNSSSPTTTQTGDIPTNNTPTSSTSADTPIILDTGDTLQPISPISRPVVPILEGSSQISDLNPTTTPESTPQETTTDLEPIEPTQIDSSE